MKLKINAQGKVYLSSGNKVLKEREKCGVYIDGLIGNVDANNKLNISTDRINFDFSGIEDIGDYALAYTFTKGSTADYHLNLNPDVSFPDLTTISGKNALDHAFNYTTVSAVSFPELTTVSGEKALCYAFYGNNNLTSISLPKLTTVSGTSALEHALNSTSISTISFPELTTVSGEAGCRYLFSSASNLTTVRFPKLTNISGNSAFVGIFNGCTALTDVYFNALTTTSFGSYVNQFTAMMGATNNKVTHTLHFPSNLQSTISGLSGYPLFGGTSGYVQLAFDLPATS